MPVSQYNIATAVSQGSTSEARPDAEPTGPAERALVSTLFDLGRQVTSVLDFDELLQQIPRLIGRLIAFEAFAVYLLDERRGELRTAYTVGYPTGPAADESRRLKPGVGLVGAAVASLQPVLVNDLTADPRYVEFVPGMHSEIVVPLVHKSKPIGALNILSQHRNQFTERDVAIVRQFAAHVAVALVNARLFERSRRDAEAFETLAEIAREVTSVLDLDQLFGRIAQLAKQLIDYRTFGILLLNETNELEMRLAVQYGEKVEVPRVRLGEGLVGTPHSTKSMPAKSAQGGRQGPGGGVRQVPGAKSGAKEQYRTLSTYDGYPSMDFAAIHSDETTTTIVRFVFAGRRLYAVGITCQQGIEVDEPRAEHFLNAFKVKSADAVK